jgi:translation initiation factor 6
MVGTMTCGNSKGLLIPHTTNDYELERIRRRLPKDVKIEKINDVFSALGNCIACNDSVALIHPEMSEESENIIAKTLQVTVIRNTIAGNPLVGTYCQLTNNAMLIHPNSGL